MRSVFEDTHTCSGCQATLPAEPVLSCPRCEADVESPLDAPVRTLRTMIDRFARGEMPVTTERTDWLTAHVIGIAQQALDEGREQLEKSLRSVREVQGAEATLPFIDRFDALQHRMNAGLRAATERLAEARTPFALQALRPHLDHALASVQQAATGLGALAIEVADPLLSFRARPVEGIRATLTIETLDALERAATAVGDGFEEDNRAHLAEALRQLDAARERVSDLLRA